MVHYSLDSNFDSNSEQKIPNTPPLLSKMFSVYCFNKEYPNY